MKQLLFLLTQDPRPFGERAGEAGRVSLLGMAAIFGVLALLWGAIELFHLCVWAAGRKKAKKQTQAEPSAPAETVELQPDTPDDGALGAAITAAITAARTEEGNTTGFRVVSFRRLH